jgi:hypothetical protein
LLTDLVISEYACDPQDAASAKARYDALQKSIFEAPEEPQTQANVRRQPRHK